ncbi:TlpA family protein disulfide reductase [Streptomyces huiliensis]|uniref:TlpA family protein disulfide reductase n=1 Tax=Streptomyces huiliensis TaxID=2876027 RepID=UPI001CBFAB3A|nr:TlpA disulfide reductase family protein [Streptomyces huiliensis]MBZ4321154.1 TlpA family protein disulfide reductase [Streptomyces huiliensis]
MSACRADRRTRFRPFRRRTTVPAVGAALAALALGACGTGGTSGGGGETQFVQGTGGVSMVKNASARKDAPELSGKTLQGEELNATEKFKGKIIVFNVWGSWCAPCRAEAKNLVKAANAYKGKGVEFVGLNVRDPDKANSVAFEKSFEVPYPSIHDSGGKLILRFPKGNLNPQAIPSTVFIDRNGKIAGRALKPLGQDELNETLDQLVAEK